MSYIRNVTPAVLLPLMLLAAPFSAAWGAAEFVAKAGIQSAYSDEDVVAFPVAHVEGDTRPGSQWVAYDVTTDAGAVRAWHQFYSCCVGNSHATGTIKFDDLVFSSPGGTGGTAQVSLNLFVRGATGGCHSGDLTLKVIVAGTLKTLGNWNAGEPPCGSTVLSSGMFAGENGSSIEGHFTSPPFTVPLDVPVAFEFSAVTGNGSYQQVVTLETFASFPYPGTGIPVFNIVSGPAGIGVQSAEGHIVANQWTGGAVMDIDETPAANLVLRLGAPHPNPASGRVSFAVELPEAARATLGVYDVGGRRVAAVYEGWLPAGAHQLTWNARHAGTRAGVYFVRFSALGREDVRRLVLVE